MTPLELVLKGFKGIKAGLNRDILKLDLSGYKNRVLIYGPNGSGKSTILQNLHPYILMPDRVKTYSQHGFNYYDECYLEDSKKELLWKYDGKVYRSVIEVNPIKKKTKAYLFEVTSSGETPIEDTKDGSVDVYIQTVEKILGSPNLFFTSVFRSQDSKRLSGYSKDEMKNIFKELLNIELLETYIENARWYGKTLSLSLEGLQNTLHEIDNTVKEEDEIKKNLLSLEERKKLLKDAISKEESKLLRIEQDLKNIELLIKENEILLQKEKELKSRMTLLKEEILKYRKTLEHKKQYYESRHAELLKRKKETETTISSKNRILAEVASLETSLSERPLLEKRLNDVEKELEALNLKYAEISRTKDRLNRETEKLLNLKSKREKKTAELKTVLGLSYDRAGLLKEVPCKNTDLQQKCLLLKDAIKAERQIPELVRQLEALKVQSEEELNTERTIVSLTETISKEGDVEKKISDFNSTKKLIFENLRKLDTLEAQCQKLKRELVRISEAEENLNYIESEIQNVLREGEESIKEIHNLITDRENELKSTNEEYLSIKINEEPVRKYEELKRALVNTKEKVNSLREELVSVEYQIGRFHETLNNLEKLKSKRQDIIKKAKEVEKEIQEWTDVSRIFNELIPLEIEDAGPEISDIANLLLVSCYGPRFSVTIITKVEAKSRKGEKDTFDVLVYDAERDSKKPLAFLSGGERVWIEEAITRAICLYNKSRSGKKFDSLFTDERDGALDAINRKKYFSMKQKVLELGQFHTEYVISHSTDAADEADFIINLLELSN